LKRRIIIAVSVLIVLITVFLLWFFNTSPNLDAEDIDSIQQYRLPSPPEIITVYDAETIKEFAEYFNALDFTPLLLIRLPSGGWYARDVITLDSGITFEIVFEQADNDDMVVKVRNRYYKVNSSSFDELLDIISDTKNKAGAALRSIRRAAPVLLSRLHAFHLFHRGEGGDGTADEVDLDEGGEMGQGGDVRDGVVA
jgi:hypothetical protein